MWASCVAFYAVFSYLQPSRKSRERAFVVDSEDDLAIQVRLDHRLNREFRANRLDEHRGAVVKDARRQLGGLVFFILIF